MSKVIKIGIIAYTLDVLIFACLAKIGAWLGYGFNGQLLQFYLQSYFHLPLSLLLWGIKENLTFVYPIQTAVISMGLAFYFGRTRTSEFSKKVAILLCLVLVGLALWGAISDSERNETKTPVHIYLPVGFKGKALIIKGIPGAPEIPSVNGSIDIRIPLGGAVSVSNVFEGWRSYKVYDSKGNELRDPRIEYPGNRIEIEIP